MEQQDIRDLRVAEISHAEWPTLGPDETVQSAIKLFAESGISGAPVVDNVRLVGIVTEGDLIFRDADIKAPGFLNILGGLIPLGSWDEYRKEALKSAAVTVDEVMTGGIHLISPQASLAGDSPIAAEKGDKVLPVPEGAALHSVIARM